MGAGVVDARSGKVVFLSHCLLNQNTRYPGGAVCPGVVEPVLAPYLRDGTGIVQMPCPEQRAWGGVTKRRLLWLMDHPRIGRAVLPLLPLARCYLRWAYRRCARSVAREIEDYLASGLRVCGVVGVAGSPSCGVRTTLDLRVAADRLFRCPAREELTADWMNQEVVGPSLQPGSGIFMDALAGELRHRRLDVVMLDQAIQVDGPPPR